MINLLPTSVKEATTYARHNTRLITWVFGIIGALLALMVVVGGSLFYLKQDTNQYVQSARETKEILKEQNEEKVVARVNELSGNLKLTLDVLSNEVLFSKLLTEIGNVMPPDTVLTALSLNSELTGALDLTILSKGYESGVKAQLNLTSSDANIFDMADISQVTCDSEGEADYPCTSTIRARFAGNNDSFMKLYDEEAKR